MSEAAQALANACTHPKVKGCRRALLTAIANLIPEGQTMTPPIADKDLAALIRYYPQAIRKAREFLERQVGVIRVVDGGQGRPASYELLALPGAGAPPALPFRADLRAVRPPDPARPLFDQPLTDVVEDGDADLRSDDVGTFHRSGRSYFGDFHRSWRTAVVAIVTYFGDFGEKYRSYVTNLGDFHRRWRSYFGDFHRSTPHVLGPTTTKYQDPDLGSGVAKVEGVARARDGDTTADDADGAPAFLVWFSQTYPSHHQGAKYRVDSRATGRWWRRYCAAATPSSSCRR
jgi:hypothetical protein